MERPTDQYAFAVELTNLAAKTTYVHHLELTTTDGRHDNECPELTGNRIEPGQAETSTGCYTLPAGEDPVGITILGNDRPRCRTPRSRRSAAVHRGVFRVLPDRHIRP